MAVPIIEANKLSTDVLQRGVVETFARTSPVLELLPFMEVEGNSYKYNVEKTLPGVAFRNVNEAYVASEGTVDQRTESLVIMGGDVDVDRFLVQTRSNVNDIRAVHTQMKSKAVAKEFTRTFFNGDAATNPKEFNGLKVRVAGTSQELDARVIEEADSYLTMQKLHALLDSVEGGADVMFMSKAMRREIQKILEDNKHYLEMGRDAFGRPVTKFGEVEIRTLEDDVLPFTEPSSDATPTNDTGSIYAVKMGALEYVAGLRNGGVTARDLGELDTLPVFRTRIEFYCGLATFHPKAVARLKGVKRNKGTGGTP